MADDKKETVKVDNRPASQIDLERRLAVDNRPDVVVNTDENWANPEIVQASHVGDGNDTTHFKGVGPEYMNYAGVEGQPFEPDEGPEAEAVRRLQGGVAKVRKTVPPEEGVQGVGVGSVQTLNTAVSGEGYSTELVDAPLDYNGGPPVVMPADTSSTSDAEETPASPVKSTPAKKAAAPAAKTSNS